MLLLLLLFIIIPITEIYLFIEIGQTIGALSTILLIILTAVLGAYFVKLQGISVLLNARQKMQEDKVPAHELFAGICILIAGLLLITPGFFTDTIGFLLLTNWFRQFMFEAIINGFLGSFTYGFVDMDTLKDAKDKYTHRNEPASAKDNVVDAEYDVIDEDKK